MSNKSELQQCRKELMRMQAINLKVLAKLEKNERLRSKKNLLEHMGRRSEIVNNNLNHLIDIVEDELILIPEGEV